MDFFAQDFGRVKHVVPVLVGPPGSADADVRRGLHAETAKWAGEACFESSTNFLCELCELWRLSVYKQKLLTAKNPKKNREGR
jgi:hypothetical protein